ncbi:flap endonuclease [Paenarthrobacter sp. DKR-5]|uniref:5'-3' exonuclease n=1 Tax=Paenarthrobacter sp. DKR-5 TaxID=2835535 RepID=UPI001BDC6585|nr:5'-3' exonuclease H3TH domain-containing protein [Paenarthrobacter sp. DKR-5]MBT1004201.1 flap endonuclease [Paenarthrobacter sp. DKR-5]
MLLDTASLYFRAFYGLPDTIRAPDGTPVNAVRGLLDMVARLVTDFEPTGLVACWDDNWRPNWRVELLPAYKAHRVAEVVADGNDVEETPELLAAQVPLIREVLGALGIPVVGAEDHEADDVIGTLSARARIPVDVVTGDRDLFQLVDDEAAVRVIYTARGMSKLELVTADVVTAKYGVPADRYADFAALRGDPSDGIPGVPGIGEKTAASLLAQFGDLAGVLRAAQDPAAGMSASVRAKLTGASAYLDVAPRVVKVRRDLVLHDPEARLHPLGADRLEALGELSDKWGLGGSLTRALKALGAAT